MINSFSDFYNNLSSNGLFFFWIVVFLFVFVIFLVIVLLMKNKKLSRYLKESQSTKNEEKDTFSDTELILEKSLEEPKEIIKEEKVNDKEVELPKEEIKEEIKLNNTNGNNGLYTKNVLREKRVQTSPISIDRSASNDNYTPDIDTTGIDLREDSLSPLEELEDIYEVNDNMKFASDIVEKMEEEVKPSNIELTDYERKQEEEAIISYGELLKVKDKIYNITDDEETDEFIDELKNFRIDLQ